MKNIFKTTPNNGKTISLFLLFFLLILVQHSYAQRITRQYNNVSFSEALKDLNARQHKYTINFVYDELEDFKVTKSIRNQNVPNAIMQLIGFYPIRMTQVENNIMVECTQKSTFRYKGRIVDERGNAAEYATIALLSPIDSTIVGHGVSNENGSFVIPCNFRKVLARITYIGYKTVNRIYNNTDMGIIKLQPKTMIVKGVVVKGDRPQYKMLSGGMEVAVEHTLLSKMANTFEVLSLLPRVSVDGQKISVFGKGAPIIYINNKRVNDNNEIVNITPDNIKSISVITSPGAEYDAEVESVIRIRTKERRANGFSLRADAFGKYNKWMSDYELVSTRYQTKKFEIANSLWTMGTHDGEDNNLITDIYLPDKHYYNDQLIHLDTNNRFLSEKLSADYSLNDSNSVGGSYRYYGMLKGRTNSVSRQDVLLNGMAQGSIDQNEVMKPSLSLHQADVYYVGKVGHVGVDFNATYYAVKNRRNDEGFEISKELGNQEVHSSNRQNSDMWAGKLVVNIPLWKGNMSVGTEMSKTDSHGTFLNEEQLVPSTKTDIHERNIAGFAQYGLVLNKWTVGLGVRYENIVRDYLSDGVKQDDVSRKYNNFFPNLSVSWNKGNWHWQLNANEKIHRPSYRQLSNFMQYDNRFLYEGGNPTLQPEKVFNAETMIMYKWLNISIGYKYLKDVMVWTKYVYPGKEFAYTTVLNFDRNQLLYASVNVSPKFGIFRPKWKFNYSQQFFDTEKYGSSKALSKPLLSCSLNNNFALSETMNAAISLNAATPNADGFLMRKSNYSVNLQFDKSFANRTWIIYLSANDIFKTTKERWTMYGLGAGTTKDCYNYTRNISLQVTYNFNAKRSKYKGTGAGNEEKSRL
ncbi:outer membrane beta-barrel protein [Prevotella stercorea]|uniref:TonB-dependent receptor domain-containing protein n=1 Tax=Leyella stercorea TaxID=363265 RepID=UPI001F183A14|nr:TonB-dependent receptor [Leyella stercorea]MCF2644718.1 outer membrane beta-barrel protein [Leyella stercorea]